jgi:hypothetical protein
MIRIDATQIQRFGDFLAHQKDAHPFDFVLPGLLPPVGGEGVIDYFFFAVAHQFGFWTLVDGRYEQPMIAPCDGRRLKGSDFIWRCTTRAWERDPLFFSPARLRERTGEEWRTLFSDDNGILPLPMWEANARIIREYTAWWEATTSTPADLLQQVHGGGSRLGAFLAEAGRIPGYREDPLRKKLMLLALALVNRPEHFLDVDDPEAFGPVIDYHLMRSALRTGLVAVDDPDLQQRLEERRQLEQDEEARIRRTVYEAVDQLHKHSGVSHAAIDWFFFQNRTRCPEMSEPDCPSCPVQSICARRTGLFQPVFRTEAY